MSLFTVGDYLKVSLKSKPYKDFNYLINYKRKNCYM